MTETMRDAEQVKELLDQGGVKCVLRERGADQHLRIIGGGNLHSLHGVEILIKPEDAQRAAQILTEAGFFGETEELTDEELEELAMSMPEITGLEDEED